MSNGALVGICPEILRMNTTSILCLKRSLRFPLGVVWCFGVPDIRVRRIWRITFPVLLGLIYFTAIRHSFQINYTLIYKLKSKDVGILITADVFEVISVYVMMIQWLRRGARTVYETIVNLAKVDDILRNYEAFRSNEKRFLKRIWLVAHLLFWLHFAATVVNVASIVCQNFTETSEFLTHFCRMVCTNMFRIQLAALDIMLSGIFRTIHLRFQSVNSVLNEMSKKSSDGAPMIPQTGCIILLMGNQRKYTETDVDQILKNLDVMWQVHERLCEITEKFCDVFWPCLFSSLLVALLTSMRHAFSATTSKLPWENQKIFKQYPGIFDIQGLALISIKCWMLISSGSYLSTEANKFGLMIHRIDGTTPALQRKVQEFSFNHYREKLIVTAGGFFVINFSTMTFMFSTIMAYTTFVYQMNID